MAGNAPLRRIVEVRRRGFFGWIFAGLFWLWNALMAAVVVSAMFAAGEAGKQIVNEAEFAGHTVGSTLGVGFLLFIWVAGAVIFGLLMWASRGRREMVEVS